MICVGELDARTHIGYPRAMTDLSSRISALMKRRGENQEEFAIASGVTQPTVNRWLNGAKPKLDALERLAELAGMTIDEFSKASVNDILLVAGRSGSAVTATLMMPVVFPNEAVLTEILRGMIDAAGQPDIADALAPRLAQRLPARLAEALDHGPGHPSLSHASGEGLGPRSRRGSLRPPHNG